MVLAKHKKIERVREIETASSSAFETKKIGGEINRSGNLGNRFPNRPLVA